MKIKKHVLTTIFIFINSTLTASCSLRIFGNSIVSIDESISPSNEIGTTSFNTTPTLTPTPTNTPFRAGYGYVTGGLMSAAFDLKLDSTGKLVSAGRNQGRMAIWRYNLDGTPDDSFGIGGFANPELPSGMDYDNEIAFSIQIHSTGSIFGVGRVITNGDWKNGLVIWKFTPEGILDTSFGTSGRIRMLAADFDEERNFIVGRALQIDSEGNLLVLGYSGHYQPNSGINTYTQMKLVIWKFNPNGTPYTSFGINGVITREVSGFYYWMNGMEIDNAGRIIISGEERTSNDGLALGIWRFNSDGAIDSTFGTNGVVSTGAPGAAGGLGANQWDIPFSLKIDGAGKILVAGSSMNQDYGTEGVLWRFNSNGTPDATFGTNGVVLTGPIGATGSTGWDVWDQFFDLKLDSAGQIITVGTSWKNDWTTAYGAIWKFNSNGTRDTRFGNDGVFLAPLETGEEVYFNSLQIDADGKLAIAGSSTPVHDPYMMIWRFFQDATLDQ